MAKIRFPGGVRFWQKWPKRGGFMLVFGEKTGVFMWHKTPSFWSFSRFLQKWQFPGGFWGKIVKIAEKDLFLVTFFRRFFWKKRGFFWRIKITEYRRFCVKKSDQNGDLFCFFGGKKRPFFENPKSLKTGVFLTPESDENEGVLCVWKWGKMTENRRISAFLNTEKTPKNTKTRIYRILQNSCRNFPGGAEIAPRNPPKNPPKKGAKIGKIDVFSPKKAKISLKTPSFWWFALYRPHKTASFWWFLAL